MLTADKAVLMDTFVDAIDSVTRSKLKKHADSVTKFKRQSLVKHTDLYGIVFRFFNLPDAKQEKRYLAAMIVQACGSLRISNILPVVTGDDDYCLSRDSFSFNLSTLKTSLFEHDHFLKLKNSKTGSFQTNFSRIGVYAAFFCEKVYPRGSIWFQDLSYDKYNQLLQNFVDNGRSHDLRRLIPSFTASVFTQRYKNQVQCMGNWRSSAYKSYSNEEFIALEALFYEFTAYMSRQ